MIFKRRGHYASRKRNEIRWRFTCYSLHNRKQNIPKDYSEYPGKTEAFWPDFLLKEWMVGAVFLIGYLILTVAHPSPLEGPADPTDTGYIPLPDWYFLFLYQLLKYEFASGAL